MSKMKLLGLALGASLLFGLQQMAAAAPVTAPANREMKAAQSNVAEPAYYARRTTVRRGNIYGRNGVIGQTTVVRRGGYGHRYYGRGYGHGYYGRSYYGRGYYGRPYYGPAAVATGAAVLGTGAAVAATGPTVYYNDPISAMTGTSTVGGSCVGGRVCTGGYYYRGGVRVCRNWAACN